MTLVLQSCSSNLAERRGSERFPVCGSEPGPGNERRRKLIVLQTLLSSNLDANHYPSLTCSQLPFSALFTWFQDDGGSNATQASVKTMKASVVCCLLFTDGVGHSVTGKLVSGAQTHLQLFFFWL